MAVGRFQAFYVFCNNGGNWHEADGVIRPGLQPDDYLSGSIELGGPDHRRSPHAL
jgi:hypothetical protein